MTYGSLRKSVNNMSHRNLILTGRLVLAMTSVMDEQDKNRPALLPKSAAQQITQFCSRPGPPKFDSTWNPTEDNGCHYHSNSVQPMIALNGHGRSKVGGVERTMIPFGSARHSIEEKWHVIGEGVPHEFFPEGEDMTVVSFHTCEAAELEEIACGSGASRIYEPSDAQQGAAGDVSASASLRQKRG